MTETSRTKFLLAGCRAAGVVNLSYREFSLGVFDAAMDRVGGIFDFGRPIIRLIEDTLKQAVKQELAPGLTFDHLDAVRAIMLVTKFWTGTRDDSRRHALVIPGWELIYIEVMRIALHGTEIPEQFNE